MSNKQQIKRTGGGRRRIRRREGPGGRRGVAGRRNYLTKQFNMEELMARLRALLRCVGEDAPGEIPLIKTVRGAGYALREG